MPYPRALWYVQRAGAVRGPYPTVALVQDRLIGRLAPDCLVSLDRLRWAQATAIPALSIPPPPADAVQRRWADTRSGHDRRRNPADSGRGRRHGPDRRRHAGTRREAADARVCAADEIRDRAAWIAAKLAIAVGGLLLLGYLLTPETTLVVRLLQ